MNLEDDKAVSNPDPEEEELLIEWANERPTVERLLTGPPVVVEGNPDDEIVVYPDPEDWNPNQVTGRPIGSGTNLDRYHDRRLSENPFGSLRPVDPPHGRGGFPEAVVAGGLISAVIGSVGGAIFGWAPWHGFVIGLLTGSVIGGLLSRLERQE